MNKESTEKIKKMIREEVEYQLKSVENIKSEDVKVLLRNYKKYKTKMEDIERELEHIKINGVIKRVSYMDNVDVQSSKNKVDFLEKKEQTVENLEKRLSNLRGLVEKIEKALEIIETNEKSEIIKLRYIENKTIDEVREIMCISYGTYRRYHWQLIKEIKSVLFL